MEFRRVLFRSRAFGKIEEDTKVGRGSAPVKRRHELSQLEEELVDLLLRPAFVEFENLDRRARRLGRLLVEKLDRDIREVGIAGEDGPVDLRNEHLDPLTRPVDRKSTRLNSSH